MNINSTKFKDLKLIKFKKFSDLRGDVIKIFNKKNKSIKFECFETYVSVSKKGTVRGLHGQTGKFSQAKIVFCIEGKALDIAVDLRKNSITYGKIFKKIISSKNLTGILIPKGFAHGYLCQEKDNKLVYLLSNYWFKKYEKVLDYKNNEINLKLNTKKIITSKRDEKGMSLNQFRKEIKSL